MKTKENNSNTPLAEPRADVTARGDSFCPKCNSKNTHQYADVLMCFDCKHKEGQLRRILK